MITQKVADQEQSEIHVVFTMNIGKANFGIWWDIKFIFKG